MRLTTVFSVMMMFWLVACGTEEKTEVEEAQAVEASEPVSPESTEIRKVMEANQKLFDKCYKVVSAKNPNVGGRLILGWMINTKGKAESVEVISNTTKSNVLSKCVVDMVKVLTFPKTAADEVSSVNYPFWFSIKNRN